MSGARKRVWTWAMAHLAAAAIYMIAGSQQKRRHLQARPGGLLSPIKAVRGNCVAFVARARASSGKSFGI